jgi:hypothetical protein
LRRRHPLFVPVAKCTDLFLQPLQVVFLHPLETFISSCLALNFKQSPILK